MVKATTAKKLTLLPNHIAIVPDGNGRWAERRGLPRLNGHRAGAENTRRMINYLNEYPVKYVTLYGFSTENWSRPEVEVKGLFQILEEFIGKCVSELHENGVRLRHLGRLSELPQSLQSAMNRAIEVTKNNTRMTLSLAFNYGGRAEVLDAVRRLLAEGVPPQNIDEESFGNYLYTAGLPNVDLLVRTGDELRLSNFLIWQTAYSEYHFTRVLWPDFGKKDMDRALLSYSQRRRRFGGLLL
ncbi:polyprenyl diphosphate synthase [Chloroflexota bacterium]